MIVHVGFPLDDTDEGDPGVKRYCDAADLLFAGVAQDPHTHLDMEDYAAALGLLNRAFDLANEISEPVERECAQHMVRIHVFKARPHKMRRLGVTDKDLQELDELRPWADVIAEKDKVMGRTQGRGGRSSNNSDEERKRISAEMDAEWGL
jgi:hypothetical protein